MKKPSEVFEGKNSSLRKTFDEVVREEFLQNKHLTSANSTNEELANWWLERTVSKADLLKWIKKNEKVEAKSIDVGPVNIPDIETQGYNTALQDLKKFISGE